MPALDLEGKACPCPGDYTCVANRCTRIGGDAGPADAPGGDASGVRLFDDEFVDTALAAVWHLDSGTWSESGGQANETSASGGTAIWVNGFDTATDYEVVTTARARSTPTNDDALEIAIRVSKTPTSYRYQCSWEPGDKFLRLFDVPRTRTNDVDLPIAQSFDPLQSFTIHARITGATLHCWVDGVIGADATVTFTAGQLGNGLGAGTFGLATYNLAGAFDYIHVIR